MTTNSSISRTLHFGGVLYTLLPVPSVCSLMGVTHVATKLLAKQFQISWCNSCAMSVNYVPPGRFHLDDGVKLWIALVRNARFCRYESNQLPAITRCEAKDDQHNKMWNKHLTTLLAATEHLNPQTTLVASLPHRITHQNVNGFDLFRD